MKYVEVTLMPGIDVPLSFLWKKVFTKVHLRLVEVQDSNQNVPFGFSFPEYSENPLGIGNKFRVFSKTDHDLLDLDLAGNLSNYSDYVHLTRIRNVPEACTYARYRRAQPNGNLEKIARRKAMREGILYSEALKVLKRPDSNKSGSNVFPYIYMKSLSSNQDFCLFIKKEKAAFSQEFFFSTYGLSSICVVPEFV